LQGLWRPPGDVLGKRGKRGEQSPTREGGRLDRDWGKSLRSKPMASAGQETVKCSKINLKGCRPRTQSKMLGKGGWAISKKRKKNQKERK